MHYEVTGVEQWGRMVPVVPGKRPQRGHIRGLIYSRVDLVVFWVGRRWIPKNST